MKKFIKCISVALLAVICALAFAGCDKSGSIKSAFEKEGYEVNVVNTENDKVQAALTLVGFSEEQKKELNNYEVILCTKSLNVAVVIKFPGDKELKEFLSDGDNTTVYDKAKENELINGNCYIATASSDAKNIFKNA